MFLDTPDLAALATYDPDVTIIGAGPLGLCMAMALSDLGKRVLVLESGQRAATPLGRDLASDELLTPKTHHPPETTVTRQLGGAGNLWGGRCVPCDPIDFEARPWLNLPAWPVSKAALDPYLAQACAALGAGVVSKTAADSKTVADSKAGSVSRTTGNLGKVANLGAGDGARAGPPAFLSPVPGLADTPPEFETDHLERWSDQPRTHILHRDRLASDPNITLALGVTVTGMAQSAPGRVSGLHLWQADGARAELPVREVVLAAGGNAATRLMLNMQARAPALFGGTDGPLGRYYMGHLNGQIADIIFDDTALHAGMDFHVDAHGSYVRRRITPSRALQKAKGLANVAFWPVVPQIAQAAHRSGPLSAVFLALSAPFIGPRLIAAPIRLKHLGPRPWAWGPHLRNLLMDPLRTAAFVPWFLWHRRYARHRVPGFFLKNHARRYGLEFHSEHLPDAKSRMTLSKARDASGLQRLEIDFRFSDRDVQSVLAAHTALEDWLTQSGLGRMEYRFALKDRAAGVLSEAQHGNHQEGTIRMGHSPEDGVVDSWGSTFDLTNLHVVSTAILPTSSQANPTLTALQLGLRLAHERLARAPEKTSHA